MLLQRPTLMKKRRRPPEPLQAMTFEEIASVEKQTPNHLGTVFLAGGLVTFVVVGTLCVDVESFLPGGGLRAPTSS